MTSINSSSDEPWKLRVWRVMPWCSTHTQVELKDLPALHLVRKVDIDINTSLSLSLYIYIWMYVPGGTPPTWAHHELSWNFTQSATSKIKKRAWDKMTWSDCTCLIPQLPNVYVHPAVQHLLSKWLWQGWKHELRVQKRRTYKYNNKIQQTHNYKHLRTRTQHTRSHELSISES